MKQLLLALACIGCCVQAHAAPLTQEPGASGFTPDEVAVFARNVQAAVKAHDVAALARLTRFPLTVNSTGARPRKLSQEKLAKEFDQVFSASIVRQVLQQDPTQLFENAQGVMFGGGAVWAAGACDDKACATHSLRIFVVNRDAN